MLTKRKITGICSLCAAAILTGVMGASSITYAQEKEETNALLNIEDKHPKYEYWLGDVDDNKQVDLNDASKVLKYALRIESANEFENFFADYDANSEINLQDADMALETALRIRDKKRCGYGYCIYGYIDRSNTMENFIKWIDTSEQLEKHVQQYKNEDYKKKIVPLKEYIEFGDPAPVLPDNVEKDKQEDLDKQEERGVLAANIKVPECESYTWEWICNEKRMLLCVHGINPLESNRTVDFGTHWIDDIKYDSLKCYVKTTQE